jgi:hypothetical protein
MQRSLMAIVYDITACQCMYYYYLIQCRDGLDGSWDGLDGLELAIISDQREMTDSLRETRPAAVRADQDWPRGLPDAPVSI